MRISHSPLAAIGLSALVGMVDLPSNAAPPEGWELVFSDEFQAEKLDAAKWSTTMAFAGTHGPRYHNEYYSSYTLDEDVILGDGLLRLRTDRRTVKGDDPPGDFDYSQGLVSTHGKFHFTYGYIEIRAMFPGGKGLWPCFWLMPQDKASWPPEFDIAEYYGGQRKMHHGLAHGTMHEPLWDSTGDSETEFEDVWHTYALQWTAGRAVWLVDGIVRKTINADYVPRSAMYVLLSNSISSRRGPSGEPDEKTVFPNFFAIDYLRVWQPPLPVVAKTAPAPEAVVVKLEAAEVPAITEESPDPGLPEPGLQDPVQP